MREPALLFRTAGKHKEQPGGTGSLTDLTQEKPKPRGTRKSQKERLKAQLAKDRGNRPREVPETRPAKRRAEGPRETTEAGTSPTSNNGECKGNCPKQMAHVCQYGATPGQGMWQGGHPLTSRPTPG